MALSGQQVLITGATGFLGSALALRLAADGVRVRALAHTPGKGARLRERGVEVTAGDVTDPASMRAAVQGCQIVFHLAVAGGSYAKQHAVNVAGTQTIVHAAAAAGVERLVYVSSVSAYGYNYRGGVSEDRVLAPGADPYAITKAEAEAVVRAGGIDYAILRPGMIYGAGAVNWTGSLFRLARRSPTPFIGSGSGSAYPIYVDDVIDLLITAADHPKASGQTFNAAPDPSPTWREFLGHYQRLAGHDRWLAVPPALFYPLAGLALLVAPRRSMARDLPDLIGFMTRQVTFKTDKARDLLGWQPRVDLAAGVTACVPWLREQGLLV